MYDVDAAIPLKSKETPMTRSCYPAFTAIPATELLIDQPDFKAGAWKPATIRSEPWEASQCFELIGGKWEGFVAIRKAQRPGGSVVPVSDPSH